jgi:hypothetical protein
VLDQGSTLLQALGHLGEPIEVCGIGFGTVGVESSGAEVDDIGAESEEPYAAGLIEVELVRLEHGQVRQKGAQGVLGDRGAGAGKHEPERHQE